MMGCHFLGEACTHVPTNSFFIHSVSDICRRYIVGPTRRGKTIRLLSLLENSENAKKYNKMELYVMIFKAQISWKH